VSRSLKYSPDTSPARRYIIVFGIGTQASFNSPPGGNGVQQYKQFRILEKHVRLDRKTNSNLIVYLVLQYPRHHVVFCRYRDNN
jgi:hypothetical protein